MRIHTIDLDYLGEPQVIASYLVEGPAGYVLIETGPANTAAALDRGLERLGVKAEDVRDVLVTHIHLDHAGAAWQWAERGATIHVHAFGARHLVDPSRLLASAERIYGEQMIPLWGELKPCSSERVRPVSDGDIVRAGGLEFRAIETPGHARHHHAFALEDVCFTGDIAAMILPDEGFTMVPTPPPEFDPVAWEASLDRLQRESFDRLYLTHFGPVERANEHLDRVREVLREHHAFVRERLHKDAERETILQDYRAWCQQRSHKAGVSDSVARRFLTPSLLAMNVDGMLRYERDVKPAQSASNPSERS